MWKSRVVCVDDEMGIRTLLKEILKEDYNVKTAGSGKEALSMLEHFNPDLIMLDMCLGDMKGIEVLSQIRRQKLDTKVIVMSGLIESDIRTQLYALKPEYILRKPFDVIKLKSKLKSIIGENMDMEMCI